MSENNETYLYYKDWCPFCRRLKGLLDSNNYSYQLIDLDKEPERFPEMVKLAKGATTVPQLIHKGRLVGDSSYVSALEAQGKLDEILRA